MSHEQSETIQREDGKWINVYGRNTPKAGMQLPGSGEFNTVDEAVKEAGKRSNQFNWDDLPVDKSTNNRKETYRDR